MPAPQIPGMSLDPAGMIQLLLGNQVKQEQATQSAVGEISSAFQEGEQKAAQSIEMQKEIVNNAAVTAGAKANIDYTQHKLMQDLQAKFNMNPDDLKNAIASNLEVADQAREQRKSVKAEYDQLAQTDILTNPIGYLFAQLKLPAVAARNNALADAEDEALGNIQTKNAILAAVKNTLVANTADAVRDVQVKEAENQRQLAQARLTGEEAKVSVQRASDQMQLFQLKSKTLDDARSTIVGISSIQGRAEAREDARQARADANADRDEMRQIRKEQLEELLNKKKADKDEEDRFNVRLLTVSQSLGLKEPMTLKTLKTLTNKKEQMLWMQAAQTGQLGENLLESLQFYHRGSRIGIQQGGGASILLSSDKMVEAGQSYEDEAFRALSAARNGVAPKAEETKKAAFDLYATTVENATNSPVTKEDMASPKWDRTYTPYKVQFLSFNSAVAQKPELAPLKNNLVKTTIDDMVKSGAVTSENLTADQQQQVFAGVVEKVRARQLLPKQAAAEISTYMREAANYNQKYTRPEQFGLAPQEAYVFTLGNVGGPTNNKKTTNLFNPDAVENAIVWQLKKTLDPNGNPFGGLPGMQWKE